MRLKKNTEFISQEFVCAHCNARQIALPIALSKKGFRLFTASLEYFHEQHKRCKRTEHSLLVTQWQSPEMWIQGTDTGISSMTIWSFVMGRKPPGGTPPDVPYDGYDFGRCLRLVRHFGWKDKLQAMADVHTEWRKIIGAWDELSELFDAGEFNALYVRLRELTPPHVGAK